MFLLNEKRTGNTVWGSLTFLSHWFMRSKIWGLLPKVMLTLRSGSCNGNFSLGKTTQEAVTIKEKRKGRGGGKVINETDNGRI